VATGFSVDLNALEEAASGVDGVLDEFSHLAVTDIMLSAAVVGHDGLANALSGFTSRWQYGVTNLVNDGKEVSSRLTANVNAYRTAEDNTRMRIQNINGELEGSGTDPGVR
jgi:hypothetical protein